MPERVSELARRLADQAEAVCRPYVSNGRRHGGCWLVGDIDNRPGRILYVRLIGGSGRQGAARRWTDAATGQYGDLVDLIAASRRCATTRDAIREARRFPALRPLPSADVRPHCRPGRDESTDAARRLFTRGWPIRGTVAETDLERRGIDVVPDDATVRFHPRCWYGDPDRGSHPPFQYVLPAMIAAVTDLDGTITGVQRTWLDPGARTKPICRHRDAPLSFDEDEKLP